MNKEIYYKLLIESNALPTNAPHEKVAAFLAGKYQLGTERSEERVFHIPTVADILLLHPHRPEFPSNYPAIVLYHTQHDQKLCRCDYCASLRARLLVYERLAPIVSTADVARFFKGRVGGEIEKEDYRSYGLTCAPVAQNSRAPVTLAGDTPEIIGSSPDESWDNNSYLWYDFADVPIGGAVWRISITPTLWHFERISTTEWKVRIVPQPSWPAGLDRVLLGADVVLRMT